jgi:hypothetical protein
MTKHTQNSIEWVTAVEHGKIYIQREEIDSGPIFNLIKIGLKKTESKKCMLHDQEWRAIISFSTQLMVKTLFHKNQKPYPRDKRKNLQPERGYFAKARI